MKYTVDKLCKNIYSIDRRFRAFTTTKYSTGEPWDTAEKELVLTH
jgi:hypothetical protein